MWTEDIFLFMKEFKTIDEQILLLKNRGMIFNREAEASWLLKDFNYYNIINGYKDPFLVHADTFKKNTSFEEVYSLYIFDKRLKDIFLKYILKIETILRSIIAYEFSKVHDNDNYLKVSCFDTYDANIFVNKEKKQKRLHDIQNLIAKLNKDISSGINNKPYIKHYMMNYGFVPLWVLVNAISFGTLANFLELMKQQERVTIAMHFGISENELIQYVKLLVYFRNICAHSERLYNSKVPHFLFIPDNEVHRELNIPQNKVGLYLHGKNDLFALVITLDILYLPKGDYELHNEIKLALNSLENELKVISIYDIIKLMNFPLTWYQSKKKSKYLVKA